jgi:hypothetical protein
MDTQTNNVGSIETHKIPEETRRATQDIEVPYLESVERDLTDSNAGNLANQGIRLLDLWHDAKGDESEYLRLLEEEAGEEVEQAYQRSYDALKGLTTFLKSVEEDGELPLLAKEMIDAKFVSEVSHGGEIERQGLKVLADHWDGDETLTTTGEIAAETGDRDPESAGIDGVVMVDGDARTVQVKTGDGGDPQDCEANWLLRVNPETGNVTLKEI